MSLASPFRLDWNGNVARRDLVAGATVAAIAVPQAIAYALIAGVDPKFGLYSAIVVTIVASILGSSSHLINGPTNAISLVIFSILAPFDGKFEAYQALFLLGIIIGTIQIVISVFKLGDLTRYVSESVVLGFMAGAGLLIAVGQIGNFLGLASRGTGDQSVVVRTWLTLTRGGHLNHHAIGLGVGTVIVVVLLRSFVDRYELPRVDMLVGLVLASAVAVSCGWTVATPGGKTIVSVVGSVPSALPSFHIPEIKFAWIASLFSGALAASLLGLLEALAVAKSIATYTRQPLDYNRQILAEGVGNLFGGFFQSLPGSGSLTRSAINYQSGAVTRASGIYSGIIVAVVVVVLGPYARFIPRSVLAGLLFITAARLIDWKRLSYAIRASRFDATLVLATAFTAVFISVEDSILVGVGLSILLFVPRTARPGIRELIVTPERVVRERQPGEERAQSMLIYDVEGELFFGAAPELDRFLTQIKDETDRTGIKYVVLRLRRARNPDVVAAEHLEHFLHDSDKRGLTILLAGLRPDFVKLLTNLRFKAWLPEDRMFPEEDEVFSATLRAVRYAYQLSRRSQAETATGSPGQGPEHHEEEEAVYYLV
jgi:sulfate permease, SulP family